MLADHYIYAGTSVSGGLAIPTGTAVGNQTKLGKIGQSLEQIKEQKTPLELQINNFVKKMVFAGKVVFFIVWGINFYSSGNGLDSLMKALTIAMSVLPEEIPVAFSTFMALGAWRLMKIGIIVKQMKTVEPLGSATVICTDKTGTITENKMILAALYATESQQITDPEGALSVEEKMFVRIATWASEPTAAKEAPEALLSVSNLNHDQKETIEMAIKRMAENGYRIVGVGEAEFTSDNFPEKQQDFNFIFKGLVAFYDPPKKNIRSVFEKFYAAGIGVKIITGDNTATTAAKAQTIFQHLFQ